MMRLNQTLTIMNGKVTGNLFQMKWIIKNSNENLLLKD